MEGAIYFCEYDYTAMFRKTPEQATKEGLKMLKELFPKTSFVPISEEEHNLNVSNIFTNFPDDEIHWIQPHNNMSCVNEYVCIVWFPGLDGESWAYFKKQ